MSALALSTSTPGIAIQLYGAVGPSAPASITDPAWIRLSPRLQVKKRHMRIALAHPTKAFRFVVVWISKVPASSVGTAQAPGRVSINEIELFPAKK
jgi:hypothetical protein